MFSIAANIYTYHDLRYPVLLICIQMLLPVLGKESIKKEEGEIRLSVIYTYTNGITFSITF